MRSLSTTMLWRAGCCLTPPLAQPTFHGCRFLLASSILSPVIVLKTKYIAYLLLAACFFLNSSKSLGSRLGRLVSLAAKEVAAPL
jgi:hypothetical protein